LKPFLTLLSLLIAGSAFAAAPDLATPSEVNEDVADVFRKAFWRQPDRGDQLLHGLRREWKADNGEMLAWQWFIVFDASQATLDHLIRGNAFGLSRHRDAAPQTQGAPDWFPGDCDGCIMFTHAAGHFVLYWDPASGRIAATDFGAGMHPPAPEPGEEAADEPVSSGRLPLHQPPLPQQ
jgi:hypothetical protein